MRYIRPHFRRAALQGVGGWDPYNVTEDADLGLRLAQFGSRTETIDCPTYEPAPRDVRTWLPQRTRWFNGWLQTRLVHMRNPYRLAMSAAVWQLCRTPHPWEKTPHGFGIGPDGSVVTALHTAYKNFGPSPMILASALPIAARSRPV